MELGQLFSHQANQAHCRLILPARLLKKGKNMQCPNCKIENAPEAPDCGVCGAPLIESEYFQMHIHPNYERISRFYRVQNGQQIDIHYRAIKAGEAPRELIAYSNVPENEVDALLLAANKAELDAAREAYESYYER